MCSFRDMTIPYQHATQVSKVNYARGSIEGCWANASLRPMRIFHAYDWLWRNNSIKLLRNIRCPVIGEMGYRCSPGSEIHQGDPVG